MQTSDSSYEPDPNEECADCTVCKTCRKFKKGDRIELTVIGVLYFGRRVVNRGTVIQQHRPKSLKKTVIICVHWDGYPKTIIGKVPPHYIQKLNQDSMAFL